MKRIILYPYIYTHLGQNGFFLYNTASQSALLVDTKNPLFEVSNHQYCINISSINNSLLHQLVSEKWGYIVDTESSPVIFDRLSFTSSKSKFDNPVPNFVGGNVFNLIERISIFVDSINNELLNTTIAQILNFPTSAADELDTFLKFFETFNFTNLKEIEIVSDLTSRAFSLTKTLISRGYFVSFRTIICDATQIDKFTYFTSIFNSIYFKVFASINFIKTLPSICKNNVRLKFWSTSLYEIAQYPNIPIIPIIYNVETQRDLIHEVLLNINDVMSIRRTLFDLKYNSIFNASFMGKITLQKKYVYTGNQLIGTFENFTHDFNSWISHKDNLWYYTRRKKAQCKYCSFCDMCPSISIFEILEILDTPCSINIKNNMSSK